MWSDAVTVRKCDLRIEFTQFQFDVTPINQDLSHTFTFITIFHIHK